MNYSDISILIPTLSRPKILLKKLNYYLKLNAVFNICICDSSPSVEDKFKEELNKLSETLKINYFNKTGLNDRKALLFLLENCTTTYSAFIADDDFFIPEGLYECAAYLEKHSDCRVAYGKSIIVDQLSLNNSKSPMYVSHYWGSKSFLESNPEERIDNLNRHYLVNLFGVHRTKDFLEDFGPSSESPSQSMGELLATFMTIAKGKGKFLPKTYLIRQSHSQRYLIPNKLADLLVDDQFGESLPLFINSLSIALASDNLPLNESKIISKKVLKEYLNKYEIRSSKSPNFNIFRSIRKRILNSLKNRIFRKSSYFADFIYYLKLISEIS